MHPATAAFSDSARPGSGMHDVRTVATHPHADHTHGIDELRAVALNMRRRVPVWADMSTLLTLHGAPVAMEAKRAMWAKQADLLARLNVPANVLPMAATAPRPTGSATLRPIPRKSSASVVFVMVNLITDLAYAKADPRVTYD